MYPVRGQGEWAVYKGIMVGMFGGIRDVQDKTMNGRRDLIWSLGTSLLCDLGQMTLLVWALASSYAAWE